MKKTVTFITGFLSGIITSYIASEIWSIRDSRGDARYIEATIMEEIRGNCQRLGLVPISYDIGNHGPFEYDYRSVAYDYARSRLKLLRRMETRIDVSSIYEEFARLKKQFGSTDIKDSNEFMAIRDAAFANMREYVKDPQLLEIDQLGFWLDRRTQSKAVPSG